MNDMNALKSTGHRTPCQSAFTHNWCAVTCCRATPTWQQTREIAKPRWKQIPDGLSQTSPARNKVVGLTNCPNPLGDCWSPSQWPPQRRNMWYDLLARHDTARLSAFHCIMHWPKMQTALGWSGSGMILRSREAEDPC